MCVEASFCRYHIEFGLCCALKGCWQRWVWINTDDRSSLITGPYTARTHLNPASFAWFTSAPNVNNKLGKCSLIQSLINTFSDGVRQSILISRSGLSVLALLGLTIIAKQIIAATHFSLCSVKTSCGKQLITNLLLPFLPCWLKVAGLFHLVTVKENSNVAGRFGLNSFKWTPVILLIVKTLKSPMT